MMSSRIAGRVIASEIDALRALLVVGCAGCGRRRDRVGHDSANMMLIVTLLGLPSIRYFVRAIA